MQESKLPHILHATCSKHVNNYVQDILYVHPYQNASYALFVVCDGHSGSEAANYVTAHFNRIFSSRIPKALPNFENDIEVKDFAEMIRKAMTETFVKLDNEWARLNHMAGTTVTVAVYTGWLLTVANCGDSLAYLDTPSGHIEMSQSHRLQNNTFEQERLRAAGATIAPLGISLQGPARQGSVGVGPMRLWPGGLCLSRSIGDLDAGPFVLPVPNIKQVLLPRTGSRLIMATDGLWDVCAPTRVVRTARTKITSLAPAALIANAARDRRLSDDVSIIVIDALPTQGISYPSLIAPSGGGGMANAAVKKGILACFGTPQQQQPQLNSSLPPPELFADVDALVQYPLIQQTLARTSLRVGGGHGHSQQRAEAEYRMAREAEYRMAREAEYRMAKEVANGEIVADAVNGRDVHRGHKMVNGIHV